MKNFILAAGIAFTVSSPASAGGVPMKITHVVVTTQKSQALCNPAEIPEIGNYYEDVDQVPDLTLKGQMVVTKQVGTDSDDKPRVEISSHEKTCILDGRSYGSDLSSQKATFIGGNGKVFPQRGTIAKKIARELKGISEKCPLLLEVSEEGSYVSSVSECDSFKK